MRAFLLSAPVFIAGCYTYSPIEPGAARPGMGVRARISGGAAERLAPLLGTSATRQLTGELIDNEPGVMVVEVPMMVQADVGSSFQTLHQRVSISRGELVELEVRQLDGLRTVALVGSTAIVVGVVVIKALQGTSGGKANPGGGSPPETRVP